MSDTRITSPIKAIKAHCKECNGEITQTKYDCLHINCFLYPFKLGKGVYERPEHQYLSPEHQAYLVKYGTEALKASKPKPRTEEQKLRASEHFKKLRDARKSIDGAETRV